MSELDYWLGSFYEKYCDLKANQAKCWGSLYSAVHVTSLIVVTLHHRNLRVFSI